VPIASISLHHVVCSKVLPLAAHSPTRRCRSVNDIPVEVTFTLETSVGRLREHSQMTKESIELRSWLLGSEMTLAEHLLTLQLGDVSVTQL